MADIVGTQTIRDLWDCLVQDIPNKTFLIFQNTEGDVREFTYGEFDNEINKTANMLLNMGIRPKDCVATQVCSSPEFMMCLFGLAKIGAIMVPVNDQYREDECAYVLNECKVRAAIIEEAHVEQYLRIKAKYNVLDRGIVVARSQEISHELKSFAHLKDAEPTTLKEMVALDSEDVVEVLFTSGTTAAPKGVMITHANVLYSGYYGVWETSLTASDRLMTTMPACHSNFQLAALTPVLIAGATLVLVEKYSARRFWKQARHYQATVVQSVSTIIRTMMLQPLDPEEKNHSVREVLYFLPLTVEEKEAFEERFNTRILNTYGSTESICWVLTDLPVGPRNFPSVGKPGLGYEVRIVDDEGSEVSPGEIGEIQVKGVKGRTLMKGYYNQSEATRAVLSDDGWLSMGDKGYRSSDGWFYFVDRKANMIKCGGENITTTEIEQILQKHPKIEEVAVIGIPDPIKDQAVKAFVKPYDNESITPEEVQEFSRQNMASFKVPTSIEIVTSFPKTASMKIKKHMLH